MPRLRDLLSAQELDLLRLVPTLPVPLADFLEAEFPARITVDRLLYALFSTIPGAQIYPQEGDYSYVNPYTDYQGWLAWFVVHRGVARGRSRDPDLQRVLNQAIMDRAGTANMPQGITRPHVWAPWQTPPQEGRKRSPQPRRRAKPKKVAELPQVTEERGQRGVTEEFVPRGQRRQANPLAKSPSGPAATVSPRGDLGNAIARLQAEIEARRARGGK